MPRLAPLPRSFYRPSAAEVAPKLLGHILVRNTPAGPCGGCIVEVEAYLRNDPACHAAPGETQRNRVMFGPPGYTYVYYIYGMHYCVNVVCLPKGEAEAVLIRALEPSLGEPILRSHRQAAAKKNLTNGPAKLCEAMSITRAVNGADLCDASSELFVARNARAEEFLNANGPMVTTTRIGITKAAELPLRFYLARSPFISRMHRETLTLAP